MNCASCGSECECYICLICGFDNDPNPISYLTHTPAECALAILRTDLEEAKRYQANRGKGGQQVTSHSYLGMCPPSTLAYLENLVKNGLKK